MYYRIEIVFQSGKTVEITTTQTGVSVLSGAFHVGERWHSADGSLNFDFSQVVSLVAKRADQGFVAARAHFKI